MERGLARSLRRVLFGATVSILAVTGGSAREAAPIQTIHASPAGSGAQSGLQPGDAMPIARALPFAAAANRPTRLLLQAGTYDLSGRGAVRLYGWQGVPLTIEGTGRDTILTGGYVPGLKSGAPLFALGRSDVTFRNFAVRNAGSFFEVTRGATAERIAIDRIDIADVHDGILVDRGKGTVAADWRIENVTIAAYVRVGIRLAGAQTTRIAIRHARIDGGGERGINDCFKGGIQLLEAVSDVTIEDTSVADNVGCQGQAYQQGDGIEIDDTQGAPRRITLRNVTASGNRDGNFDLKADGTVLEGLVSRAEGRSRHGFRLWNYAYTCLNCRVGAEAGDVQVVNADVTFRDPDAAPVFRCADRQTSRASTYRVEARPTSSGRRVAETVCPRKPSDDAAGAEPPKVR